MDSVNSTTFIKRPPHMSPASECLLYTKELLSRRIFLGCYEERRYVSVLREYRDVVAINCEEKELHNDLDKIRKKWFGITDIKWVGITGPKLVDQPKVYCFWVKLSNLPFGHYWFQIKHVKCSSAEVFLQLKCVRKALSYSLQNTPFSSKTFVERNEVAVSSTAQESTSFQFDPKTALESMRNSWKEAVAVFYPCLTWKNFVTVLRVITAVAISIIFGCISAIPAVGEFVLKLIRELTLLVQAISPIIVQLIDFITKITGGLFILVFRFFDKYPRFIPANSGNNRTNRVTFLETSAISSRNAIDWRERNRVLREELLGNKINK